MDSDSRYTSGASHDAGNQGFSTLVSGLIEDLQSLVRSEVQLAKTEIREDVRDIGKGAGMIAAGALVGLVGFIFLMLGATYLLNKVVEMWIAAGIVGLVLVIIAAGIALAGKGKLSAANLKPDQTIDSIKENKEWANRQMKSVRK